MNCKRLFSQNQQLINKLLLFIGNDNIHIKSIYRLQCVQVALTCTFYPPTWVFDIKFKMSIYYKIISFF